MTALQTAVDRRRRLSAFGMVIVALAAVALVVFFASRADGREVSRASSNDGGAWLINRDLRIVGHKNRSSEELSTFMRVTDSPSADVFQAPGIVVVHDPDTQTLLEVDVRGTFNQDLQPTDLPELSRVQAIDQGLLVIREIAPASVRWVSATDLPSVTNAADVVPIYAVSGSILAAAHEQTIAVVDLDTNALIWMTPDGTRSEPIALPARHQPIAVTLADGTAAILSATNDVLLVDRRGEVREVIWAETGLPPIAPAGFGQPSSQRLMVAGMSATGELMVIDVRDASATSVGALPGENPLRPIAHDGCVYGVVTAPPQYGVVCPAGFGASQSLAQTEPLEGAGDELRLRLVNGWIWINDLGFGGVWTTTDDLSLAQIEDWGRAAEQLTEDAPTEGSDSVIVASDEVLIEDPDGVGDVRNGDRYDPTELNVPPEPEDDEARTRVNRSVVVPVLANDADRNNDILLIEDFTITSGEATAAVTPRRDGIQVTPASGYVGVITLEYQVSDGRSDAVAADVTVSIIGDNETVANAPPVPVTDVVATAPGNRTTIDVLLNDSDPDGDVIALKSIVAETGTLRFDPSGQVSYTPDSTTEAGRIDLPYVVVDDFGAEAIGTLRVEIRDRGANQEPDARNDSAVTVVGRPVTVNLLENDSDPDGDALTMGSPPEVITPDGAVLETTISADGEFVFVPREVGTYLFSYTVTDSAEGGSERDTARVRIDVLPADENRPPVAVRDNIVIPVGQTRVAYVLDNDGDPDGDVIGIVDWIPTEGLVIDEFIDERGHIGFRITVLPGGPPRPTFNYTISDGTSEPATASVVIAPVAETPRDQPPVATDDVIEARAGSSITGLPVLANDFDPERGYLVLVNVTEPDEAEVTISEDRQTLDLRISEDVTASFTFAYDIEDSGGNRASGFVRVQLLNPDAINRSPVARVDSVRTSFESAVAIAVLNNDSDPDGDTILLEGIAAQPAFGTAEVNEELKSIVYRPDQGFSGTDRVRYSVVDQFGARSIGEVLIGVMPAEIANLAPTANNDSYTVIAGSGEAVLDVVANDFDPESDPLRATGATQPTDGEVFLDSSGRLAYVPPETVLAETTATFSYTVSDPSGNTDDGVVTVTIRPVAPTPTPTSTLVPTPTPTPEADQNSAPGAEPTAIPTASPSPVPTEPPTPIPTAIPTAVPTDVPTSTPVPAPSPTGTVAPTATVTPTPTPTPTTTPTPAPDATPTDVPTNIAPITVGDEVGPVRAGTEITVRPVENDRDPDGDAQDLVLVSVTGGGVVVGRTVTFVAPTSTEEFTYTIEDVDGNQATGVITIFVTQNEPPVVESVTLTTPYETPLNVTVSGLASDPDGDDLFFVCCASVRGGRVEAVTAGANQLTLTFVPDDGSFGTGGFAYTVDDQQGHQISGTVSIVVEPPTNQPPTAADNTVQVPQDDSITVELAPLSEDPDGDPLTWTLAGQTGAGVDVSLNGSVATISADRSAPTADRASFTYTVSDGELTATGTITIVVTEAANTAPVADDMSLSVSAGASEIVDLVSLVTDPDFGDSITWEFVSGNTAEVTGLLSGAVMQVSASITSTGATASLVYSATDLRGESDTGTISVTVQAPAAPPPEARNDRASTKPGELVEVPVLANDVDPLGLGLTVVSASAPQGVASPSVDGQQVVYEPGSFIGLTAVNYTIEDSAGRQSSATVAIDTLGPPDAPAPPAATASAFEATLTWTTPQTNGSPITGYILRHDRGGEVTVGVVNNYTWTGLTNDLPYTFTAQAINAVGPGIESGPSIPVTPDIRPEQPSAPAVQFQDGALLVTWSAPANQGSPIDAYQLEIGGSLSEVQSVGNTTSFTWTGLANGAEYTFKVRARNKAGWSPLSPPSPSEHPETVPGPPIIGATTRGNTALDVNWSPPTSNGGGTITEYRVIIDDGTVATVSGANVSTYPWANLVNGTERTFQVRARNRAGWGPPSGSSAPVKPCGTPDAPGAPTVTRGDSEVDVSWSAPGDQGCTITGYVIEAENTGEQNSSNTGHTYTNLANGTAYRFRIVAVNEEGRGTPGPWSTSVTPAGLPGCVNALASSATGVGEITATWQAAVDNGAPILQYQYSIWGGPWVDDGPDLSAVTTGHTESHQIQVLIRAVNDVGVGLVCGSTTAQVWSRPNPTWIGASATAAGIEISSNVTYSSNSPAPTSHTVTLVGCDGTCNVTVTRALPPYSETFLIPAAQLQSNTSYLPTNEVCNPVGCTDNQPATAVLFDPVGTISMSVGNPSTAPCWNGSSGGPTQGCFTIRIVLSGWTGSHTIRCFSTMNSGPMAQFSQFTAANGTHEQCSYTLAGRKVRVTVDGAPGNPDSGSVRWQCEHWPINDPNDTPWSCYPV